MTRNFFWSRWRPDGAVTACGMIHPHEPAWNSTSVRVGGDKFCTNPEGLKFIKPFMINGLCNWWRRRESNQCRVFITRKLLILDAATRTRKAGKADRLHKRCTKRGLFLRSLSWLRTKSGTSLLPKCVSSFPGFAHCFLRLIQPELSCRKALSKLA